MAALTSVLLIGLLGGIHCIGMCGGFVLTIAQASPNRYQYLLRQSLYYLGKTGTYAALGAIVGGLGHLLGNLFAGAQTVISIALGFALILIGMGILGIVKKFEGHIFLRPWKALSSSIGHLLRSPSNKTVLALGLINGLLPCGLVYGALALATASGTAANGAGMMAAFGLSTIPALFLTSSLSRMVTPTWKTRIQQFSGVLVIILGLITIARGFPSAHHHHHHHTQPTQPSHQLMHPQ